MWGGLDNNFVFHNDGGRYNPRTDSWLRTVDHECSRARSFHSSVWTGSEMIIWGGIGDIVLSDGGRYDPVTDNWKTISPVSAPLGAGMARGCGLAAKPSSGLGAIPAGVTTRSPIPGSSCQSSMLPANLWTHHRLDRHGVDCLRRHQFEPPCQALQPGNDTWTNATAW